MRPWRPCTAPEPSDAAHRGTERLAAAARDSTAPAVEPVCGNRHEAAPMDMRAGRAAAALPGCAAAAGAVLESCRRAVASSRLLWVPGCREELPAGTDVLSAIGGKATQLQAKSAEPWLVTGGRAEPQCAADLRPARERPSVGLCAPERPTQGE